MANEQTRGMTDFATQTNDTTGAPQSRARELVNQAIERLDALYLGRLLKGLPARRTEAPP